MSVKQYRSKKTKGYESISRDFLQRNDLSLEARGLLAYMHSMPEEYIFHKTQLYKCFDKNKKTSVERIWNELLDAQFILAFSKGIGPRQKFDYIYSQEGFSEEEIQELNKEYLSEGWEIAYRLGTNRKPASYYEERKKNKKISELKTSEGSNYQGVENQHPDNSGISLGVGFQQLGTNSSESTGIKLNNKDLIINDDDDEKNNKKEKLKIFSFENQNWEKVVETEKIRLKKVYGNIAFSLIKNAEIQTKEHLYDMNHYWDYLFGALQNEEQKYQKFTVEMDQNKELEFYIPFEGPWNS